MPRAFRSGAFAMTLLICRTCPRYDPRSTGQFSRDLTDAIAALAIPPASHNPDGSAPRAET